MSASEKLKALEIKGPAPDMSEQWFQNISSLFGLPTALPQIVALAETLQRAPFPDGCDKDYMYWWHHDRLDTLTALEEVLS